MILYKKVLGEKSSYSEKCMGTKDVFSSGKKGLILKTSLAILNMQMYGRKLLLCKRLRLDLILSSGL